MKENLQALDGIRGLTALYVLIHHARLYLTLPYINGLGAHPEKYQWYDKMMVYFFSFFKFGHEAVILFFLLSGFVIHLKQANSTYQLKDFNKLTYLKKRFIRIYPTLLISFILCVLADYLITAFTDSNANALFAKYQLPNFIYNLFLIPDAPIWGTNFPMWSLKHEWFFYMLYPMLLWLSTQHKSLPIVIGALLFCLYFFGIKIPLIGAAAYTLLIWMLGSILAEIYINKKTKIIKYLPLLIFLGIFHLFLDRSKENPILDLITGLMVTGFLAFIVQNKSPLLNLNLSKFAWLGTFSYSLYLLHIPLLNLFQAIIIHLSPSDTLPYHYWFVIMAIVFILPFVYGIYYYTERYAINFKAKYIH